MVYPANGSLILKEESWPAEARNILFDFATSEEAAQRGSATPRFIVARGDKVVLTATGNGGWKDTIWPKLQELTAAS